MQLKLTTNYAIRALSCLLLHKNEGFLSSIELGEMLDISSNYILKILRVLSKEKFVIVEVGKYGGFRINTAKEPIYLYDIIALMEPTILINDCLELHPKQNSSFEEKYHIKKYWQNVQTKIDQMFSITLEDLIHLNNTQGETMKNRSTNRHNPKG